MLRFANNSRVWDCECDSPVLYCAPCMMSLVGKFVLLFALLVMPLQGVAASLSALFCPPAVAAATDSPDGDDGAVNNVSEHFFCHQLHSAIPVVPAPAAIPDLPVFEPSISLLSSLFFPEQPQRPPFAGRT